MSIESGQSRSQAPYGSKIMAVPSKKTIGFDGGFGKSPTADRKARRVSPGKGARIKEHILPMTIN